MQISDGIWIHFLCFMAFVQAICIIGSGNQNAASFSFSLIVYTLSASIIVITSSSELQTSYKFSPIAAHQTTFFTKLEKSCKFSRAAQNFPSLQCLSLQTRTCQDHNHRDLKEQHVPRMEAFSETVHSIPICKNWSSQL